MNMLEALFSLDNKVIVITGGSGLMGVKHAEIIAAAGGSPVLWDINLEKSTMIAADLSQQFNVHAFAQQVDITSQVSIQNAVDLLLEKHGSIHGLVNNAANNPHVKPDESPAWTRLENLPDEVWEQDLAVGLKGAYLCSRVIGQYMAECKEGVILNIASDLGLIAPDQRLYRKEGVSDDEQPVKPVTYSVVKHGLIGLTKYLATYYAESGIRVNSLSPGGIYVDQPEEFVHKLAKLIPMGRMASIDEYQGAVLFLLTAASSYTTGTNLTVDGGRTCW